MPRVLNIKTARGSAGVRVDRTTKWGNPFRIGEDGDRNTVILKHREWIQRQPGLLKNLKELRGKDLLCWCAPEPCHADTLLEFANRGSLASYLNDRFADVVRTEADLTDDQREAIEFAWGRPFSALYIDVGGGKTAASLSVIDRLWMNGYYGKVLIIAPIRVATRVWPYEPRLWSHLAYMETVVIRVADGDPRLKDAYQHGYQHGKAQGYAPDMCRSIATRSATRAKHRLLEALIGSPEQIHVINKEAVEWLVERCSERGEWPYKVVFVDEASCLGDHKSGIFKALQRVLPHIKRLHELTASPASQTYMKFFSQIFLLDRGERFGRGITAFRERYFTQNRYTRRWTIRPGADQEIERLIADICLVMRRKRDFQVRIRPITLPPEVLRSYREFERELVLTLPDDVVIDGVNAAVLCGKLLQYASGTVYDAERTTHAIHDEKIEELRSLIDETLDQPVMVAYWFKASLARLKAAFPYAVVMDREGKCVEAWNKKRIRLLLVHPQSAGHGLNLQHGGHHAVLFDLFHSVELFTQLIGRLDRPGQLETVMVHLLCAKGTIDDLVAANLQYLRDAEESMFRRLQALRRRFAR